MKKPAEVYYVEAKFTSSYGARAGVKGGRVARLEHALARRAAIHNFDPKATVRIYRSNTEWVAIDD